MERVEINTEFIKLDQLLKWMGVADTGAFAKIIIKNGDVYVNGIQTIERGKKIKKGDVVEVVGVGKFEIV